MSAFVLVSVACGPCAVIGRAARRARAAGAAAALLLPSSLALVRLAYPHAGERAQAIAIWAAVGGVALAAGPVVGGLLTDTVDWRAIFLINVPVGIAAVLGTAHGPRSARKRTPLDLPGQAAALVAVGAVTFGVIEAGHEGLYSAAALADGRRDRRRRPAVQLRLLRPGVRPQPVLPAGARPQPAHQRADVPAADGADRRDQHLGRAADQRRRAAAAAAGGPAADGGDDARPAGAGRRLADGPDPAVADPGRDRRRAGAAADGGVARGRCRPSARASRRASSTPRVSSAAAWAWRCSAG